ncbi:hypothetical protein Q5P01_004971 [Channa striata]|uniref:Uncharacterized protein n=1 Tax=Channa striata TaxID=64152 RepID=A0AA88NF85_CHASR|nr:hypothetical protein Q5P01_004971 [Channa striata]
MGFVLKLLGEFFVKGVSERQGKSRTCFISTMRSRKGDVGTDGHMRGQTAGCMTLAEVVFGLIQARHKETMREASGGFRPTPCTPQC